MTVAVWCAWLAILVAPWLACVTTAMSSASTGRTATQALGAIWCVAAALLFVLVDAPVDVDVGNWFAVPATIEIPVTFAWTISPVVVWGVAVSGLVLWWLAGSEHDDGRRAQWVLVQLICGVVAQAWFLDNAWLLLIAQVALTGLCALLLSWQTDGPTGSVAVRSLWMASAWADGVLLLAVLGAAFPIASLRLSDLADAGRVAELHLASEGIVPLVGLLWGIAMCGRLFQFPFSAVRDLSEPASPLVNGIVWGVALLPLMVRWLFAGRVWWSATAVITDLADGWSEIAALAAVWCALATMDLRVRVTWLLGAQVSLAIPALIHEPVADVSQLIIEHWCVALAASAWLFVVLPRGRGESSPAPLTTTVLVWLAAASLCGLVVGPAMSPPDESPRWSQVVHLTTLGLSGLATVLIAVEAGMGRLSARALWGSAWLLILPLVAVIAAGRTGGWLMSELESPHAISGWSVGAIGIVVGLVWRRCPAAWQSVWNPLVRVGRQRFSTPKMMLYGVNLPVRGVAQLCRFLDWFVIDAWLLGSLRRMQRPSGVEDELRSAGSEFYALALGLTAAAITLTVMWLAQ